MPSSASPTPEESLTNDIINAVFSGLVLPVVPDETKTPLGGPNMRKSGARGGKNAVYQPVQDGVHYVVIRQADDGALAAVAKVKPDVAALSRTKLNQRIARTLRSFAPGSALGIDPAALKLAGVIDAMLPQARRKASEATIEKLVDALVETQDPLAGVSAKIDADNAKARHGFMADFRCYTAAEVTKEAGSGARNRSQTASRWKAEGRIFAVPYQGLDRFPAFQFSEGRPLPVIGEILAVLPDRMSNWEIAYWFVSTNGWLDGATPRECLSDVARVVEAARRESETVLG